MVSTPIKSSVILIYFFSSRTASISSESAEEREDIMRILAPFVFAGFRVRKNYVIDLVATQNCHEKYPITSSNYQDATATPITSIHGPYPPSGPPPQPLTYFGQQFKF